MLPSKLATLKSTLQSQIYLNDDDKKALQVLKVLDSDSEFQKLVGDDDLITKSFAVAPEKCPSCGRKL